MAGLTGGKNDNRIGRELNRPCRKKFQIILFKSTK